MAFDEFSFDFRLSQMERQIAALTKETEALKSENKVLRQKQIRSLRVTAKLTKDTTSHYNTLKYHDENLVFLIRRTAEMFHVAYPKQGKLYAEMRQILKMGDDQIEYL